MNIVGADLRASFDQHGLIRDALNNNIVGDLPSGSAVDNLDALVERRARHREPVNRHIVGLNQEPVDRHLRPARARVRINPRIAVRLNGQLFGDRDSLRYDGGVVGRNHSDREAVLR